MINLLPDSNKKELRAGRANTTLRQYIFILLLALAFLAGVVGFAWVTLQQSKASAELRLADSEKASAAFVETKKEAEEFRTNLTTAKAILDKNITYSYLMLRVADLLPYRMYLSQLSLDAAALSEPILLDVTIRKKKDATDLRKILAREDALFSDVHIVSIDETEAEMRATLSVTLAKGAFDEQE